MMEKTIHRIYCDNMATIENPIVFELGSHKGEDTQVLASIPNVVVHAFECDPRNSLEHLPDNVIKNYKAIADFDGLVGFYQSKNGFGKEWTESGSMRLPKNHLNKYDVTFQEKPILVDAIRLDTYCEHQCIYHIDFLWADLQGCEIDMIRGGRNILSKTIYIYTEYSNEELYAGQITLNDILDLLPDFQVVFIDNAEENVLLKNMKL